MKTRLLLAFLLLGGCSAESNLGSDYTARLENVLDVQVTFTAQPLPEFPAARQLNVSEAKKAISVREFLSLRECKLHTVLAHRNSLIGKFSEPSQALFSDLDILATGPACLEQIDDKALANKLNGFLADKKTRIANTLARAILGEAENRSFWSVSSLRDNYPEQLQQETIPSIQALDAFADAILKGKYTFSKQEYRLIERHLGHMRFGDGGMLLSHYFMLANSLEHGNALINERLKRPLCLTDQPSQKAMYFQNVVNQRFIQQLQRRAILLKQRKDQLMPTYLQLEMRLIDYAPEAYQQWVHARDQLLSRGENASKLHARTIQALFRQCGLTAGKPMR